MISIKDGNGKSKVGGPNGENVSSCPQNGHKPFDSKLVQDKVTVTVGEDGEALIIDYHPYAGTPHNASPDSYAKSSVQIGIIDIKNVSEK